MKYIIIDWFSNVCFDSHELDLTSFDEASEFLDESLLNESPNLESCENNECICNKYGHQCDDLESLREDYIIQEYDEDRDALDWNGLRYMLRRGFYIEEKL